jgi:ABC-type molybdate transport system substrate-binding protein
MKHICPVSVPAADITDVLLAKQAKKLFTAPQEMYSRAAYPMALTDSGAKNKETTAFFAYLHGDEAKTVLVTY